MTFEEKKDNLKEVLELLISEEIWDLAPDLLVFISSVNFRNEKVLDLLLNTINNTISQYLNNISEMKLDNVKKEVEKIWETEKLETLSEKREYENLLSLLD